MDAIERAHTFNHRLIQDFFQRDSRAEMIESIHSMIEAVLFAEDLSQVTPEMRVHIVNQLRVATFIARLEAD